MPFATSSADTRRRINNPSVSVIVPVYNAAAYLQKCLDSILAQSFRDFELILVDDGSTDGSGAIADRCAGRDGRVRVFHKTNAGVSQTRNYGLSHADGEFVTFIDSDDFLSEDFLAKLLELMTPETDFCFGNLEMLTEKGNFVYQAFEPGKDKQETLSNLFSCGWMCSAGVLFRRSFLEDNHLSYPEHINYTEDVWILARAVFYARSVAKTQLALYQYNRINSDSITHRSDNPEAERKRLASMAETIAFLQDNDAFGSCRNACYWRILVWKSWMALCPDRYDEFNASFPEANAYICSNPFLSGRMKILLWLIAHRLYLPARLIVRLY